VAFVLRAATSLLPGATGAANSLDEAIRWVRVPVVQRFTANRMRWIRKTIVEERTNIRLYFLLWLRASLS